MREVTKLDHNAVKNTAPCKKCGTSCSRHSKRKRTVAGLNFKVYVISFSVHYCQACNKYFSSENAMLTGKGNHFTEVAKAKMVEFYEGRTLEAVKELLLKEHGIKISISTLHDIITRREGGGV